MKVAIITEGSGGTGYGHLTRCLSIYQAFEEKGIIPLLIANCDEQGKSFIPNVNPFQINWLENENELLKRINGFDIVIIDSYLAPVNIYEHIYMAVKKAVYIDDFNRLDYPPGILVNGTIGSESLPYKKDGNHKYLLGIRYIPIRKEFWDIEIPEREYNKTKNVLITFGAKDNRNLTIKVLEYLVNEYPQLTYYIVIGDSTEIKEIEKGNTYYYHPLNAEEILNVMLKCDLTISAAGQTTYELARLGMPTIAVGIAENQKYNLQGWREIGFIKNEIWYTDVNLLEGIKEQLSTHINSNISKRKVFCDGQGARRIIDIVLVNSTVNRCYLRKFKESDARIIYELSNDDEVRKVSISQDKIDWETHINWFNKKINDSNSYYLIAHDFNNNFIGQIKFDIINQIAIVSISIHKDFRGKRFGAEILRIGCKLFFYCHPNINSVEAYIEDNNINSIRSFLKAGFDFKDHTVINQRNFNLYLFNRI